MLVSAKADQRVPKPENISSRDNRWLKKFRQALRGGEPTEEGYIGMEGAHLVEEALRSGLEVAAVLVSAGAEHHLELLRQWRGPDASGRGPAIRVLQTSDRLFASVADTQTPQGIAALVRPRAASFDELVRGTAMVAVLCAIQDPGNVGTILRSAEAFGASGAIASRGTANPFSPKSLRASAGSALRLPVLTGAALPVAMAQLRIAGLRLCAACSREGVPPAQVDLRGPVAFFIGAEGTGLPPEVERSADARLLIPLSPAVESLNAAAAASVLFYEAARQRAAAS